VLFDAGDLHGARAHYHAALETDPAFAPAHQGLARVLTEWGDAAAEAHRQRGYAGHAVVTRPFRGVGSAVPLLLLVSARGGNVPTAAWIDDRRFAVTAIHAEFHDSALPLPPHALVVNAIGDAELCGDALARADAMLAGTSAPVINPPARVRMTGRADNARRLGALPGVIAPAIRAMSRADLLAAADVTFPVLLRAPGCHTGRHFHRVADRGALGQAAGALPGDDVLAIPYLDTQGADGMWRKYRVMLIDGQPYPLHLAVAGTWKVHWFTADMAANARHRDEERHFLDDMPTALGERAMTALAAIAATLGLEYAGVDFALAADGSLLLFEANATMVVQQPDADPMWDYRRAAVTTILDEIDRMLRARVPP
jgi:glutathione synthase/RimK-type ligase-like ATP-grasp enzyme